MVFNISSITPSLLSIFNHSRKTAVRQLLKVKLSSSSGSSWDSPQFTAAQVSSFLSPGGGHHYNSAPTLLLHTRNCYRTASRVSIAEDLDTQIQGASSRCQASDPEAEKQGPLCQRVSWHPQDHSVQEHQHFSLLYMYAL